jgi:hypothetical protein
MSEYVRPSNTTNPILDPILYWRVSALALTAVAILGIVMASIYGGGEATAKDQLFAFHGEHALGFTWTHNVIHVVLAVAAFVFGFANVPARVAKVAAIVFGVVYGGLGIVGFLYTNPLGDGLALNLGYTLNAVHLLLAAWALLAGFGAKYDPA